MNIKIEGWIHYAQPMWDGDLPRWTFFSFRNEDASYVPVCPHTIEQELPDDYNPTALALAQIELRREELKREFTAHIAKLDERASKLQALEFTQ